MRGRSSLFAAVAILALRGTISAAPITQPGLARSAHFEVYAQGGAADARAVLLGFERLHAYFLQQTGLELDRRPPVRVIAFNSRSEYEQYQLRPAADAYYVGTESRDTIVLTTPGDGDLRVAAHEYAHFALHAAALELPPWLNEGLSEFFSEIRSNEKNTGGAKLPPRSRVLLNRAWMPLAEVVSLPADSPLRERRDAVDLFYAESWALADMLMVSPSYRPRFPGLLAALSSGEPSDRALAGVYRKPLDDISADLRTWVEERRITPTPLPDLAPGQIGITASSLSPLAWRSVLAELLLETGKLDRAEAAFTELAREAPQNATFPADLALIALQKRDWSGARRFWQRALDQGLDDAAVCYRYALRADAAGLSPDDLRPALERAVALQPAFDNAHYMLARLDNNAGRYDSAVAHLNAMHTVTPARQFAYWAAKAYALGELGRREEAETAAIRAREHAATAEERLRAAELYEIAATDVAVRFATDVKGNSRLVTTRVPHGEQNWNPFIEPGDRIRRAVGTLLAIHCEGSAPQLVVATPAGPVTVTIADPQRVQMRNAPQEFTCGPQPDNAVTVVYAAAQRNAGNSDGIVRGIEFH